MRKARLTTRREFATVYARGRPGVSNLVVVKAVPNGLGFNRYGFSVGKGLGNAVARNRVKRLLREIARLVAIEPGWDIVFIARRTAATADYHSLKEAIEDTLARLRLLRGEA